ncbi:MAG: acyl-CoA dehydrogenase family protein [Deltaproteobacteria bacterium]|nr:acyl-CoA dehydrogenase family protein [Deltaproteobacteria bacterium]
MSEEHQLLRETVEQVARDLGPDSPQALDPEDTFDAGWEELAGIGLLGMRLPESAGGTPMSGVEVALVAAELGRFLVPAPFLGSAVCASEMLRATSAERALLERLASGTLRLAPVLDPDLNGLARAGAPGVAWDSSGAAAGLALDESGGRLVCLELGERKEGVDLTRTFRLVDPAAARRDVGDLGGVLDGESLQRLQALTMTALGADLVGIMQGALEDSVAHVASREQFGAAVGSFQAVQHLAAEAKVSLEAARSSVLYAAWAVDLLSPGEALFAARTAKACASIESRSVTETALQMHGGVGFTWEYMTHVRVRRALLSRKSFGDERAQLHRIADARLSPRDQ